MLVYDDGMKMDADLVLVQLRRIRNHFWGNDATPLPSGAQPRHLSRALSSHLAAVAGICVAALVWDLVSDHMPLWQLLAALVLVGAFGGVAFRLGQKAATGLETS